MTRRIIFVLVFLFILVFSVCFYFYLKNKDSFRNYVEFHLMKTERIRLGRALTQPEKERLKLILNYSGVRYKDTLNAVYIYDEEFFRSRNPLFFTLSTLLLDTGFSRSKLPYARSLIKESQ